MLSKISVGGIVAGHWASLRSSVGKKVSIADVGLFYGFPFALAVLLLWRCVRLADTDALLNLAGILFGFLSAIYFFVLERSRSAPPSSKIHREFVDQVRHNVGYISLVLLVLMILLVLPVVGVGIVEADGAQKVSSWLSATLLGLWMHLLLTMLMIIKRVHGVAA